jgi:ribosomal protein S27AE
VGTVKGIKGQTKEHARPRKPGLRSAGKQRKRVDEGALRYHSCCNCRDDVVAPDKVRRVQCGRCTLLSVEKAREDGKL